MEGNFDLNGDLSILRILKSKLDIVPSDKIQNEFSSYKIDKGNQVIAICLNGNNCDIIPIEIYLLQNLTHLSFINIPNIVLSKQIKSFKKLKSLVISGCDLEAVNGIMKLCMLEHLDLSHNNLSSLPMELGGLSKLKSLIAGDNLLEEIPNSICNLESLEYLDLTNNLIQTLPKLYKPLRELMVLHLDNNNITSIPPSILNLPSLTHLTLSQNYISFLPKELGELDTLEILSLNNNQINNIEVVSQILSLKELYCSNNSITDISSLSILSNIEVLLLDNNNITDIKDFDILKLNRLLMLDLRNNSIKNVRKLRSIKTKEYIYYDERGFRYFLRKLDKVIVDFIKSILSD